MTKLLKAFVFLLVLTAVVHVALTSVQAAADRPTAALLTDPVQERESVWHEASKSTAFDDAPAPVFKLPASLKIIEDEAFEDTAIENVALPESVESVGERAFASITTLRSVRIPDNTQHIAATAFEGSRSLTIIAASNSYARNWAKENGIAFEQILVISAGNSGLWFSIHTGCQQRQTEGGIIESCAETEYSLRCLPVEERIILRHDRSTSCLADGRAPPA